MQGHSIPNRIHHRLGGNTARRRSCFVALAISAFASLAHADLDLGGVVESWRNANHTSSRALIDPFRVMSRRGDGVLRLIVKPRQSSVGVWSGSRVTPRPGMMPLRSGGFTWAATPEEVAALVDERPDLRVLWSAPKHVLLDRAVPLTRADIAHRELGLTGKGVAVGIVDTGLDIRHSDLRNPDGTTRIAWLLDMSHDPIGRHPELEKAFECDAPKTPCAVYSNTDLDEILAGSITSDEPRDVYGHGTHVTSLAAGNGIASPSPKYIGMAPDASIIAVRATRDDSGIVEDADILSAVQFIFKVADEALKMPVVANLSLGGDFGAHDGTSELERELAQFVGPNQPGHSIVVAAGNSGSLYHSTKLDYPNPFGIHTVAQVLTETSVRVPVLVMESVEPKIPSQVYIWVAARPGDRIKVGLDKGDRRWIAPVDLGELREAEDSSKDYYALIHNGVTESDKPELIDHSGTQIVIQGPFEGDQIFALRFEGHGTASIWVQAAGGIDPALNGVGAILPSAQREGTISIPGTSTELIAVGATLNHLDWTTAAGARQLASNYLASYFQVNEVLSFSAAGPTAVDVLKPDLVAPGGLVAGAMSRLTDPRTIEGENSMFLGSRSECFSVTDDCLVVDDQHALSTGTSMASPIVAGAIALLLQRDPTLTQQEILLALQAGASTVDDYYSSVSQVGAGVLDVENALLALDGVASDAEPSLTYSWIGLGNSYTRPDPNWPIAGLVHLRDANNRAVDVESRRLTLAVDNGRVLSPLERHAPGYYRFEVAGAERTAGQSMRVELRLDGRRFLTERRNIAVDAPNTDEVAVAGRGCAVALPNQRSFDVARWLLVLGVAMTFARRVRRSAAV